MIREIFLIVFCVAFVGMAMAQGDFQYENVAMGEAQYHPMMTSAMEDDPNMDQLVGRRRKFKKHHHHHHRRRPFGHRGHHHHHHRFRVADEDEFELGSPAVGYESAYIAPSAYAAASAYYPAPSSNSVSCGSNILVGCSPSIQNVPCTGQPALY